MVGLKSASFVLLAIATVLSLLFFDRLSRSVPLARPLPLVEQCYLVEPHTLSDTLFATVHGYAGQQGSAALSLSTFQCFLASFHGKNALIAEPKFWDSGFNTHSESPLDFSSVLDFEYFNEQSRKIGYPEMITQEDFTKRSPRYGVYIHIRGLGRNSKQEFIWESVRFNGALKCLDLDDIKNLSKTYSNLKYVHLKMCVVRVVELWAVLYEKWDGKCAYPISDIRKFIFGEWTPKEVTLMFSYWAFYVYPPMTVPPGTKDCMNRGNQLMISQFQPSKGIIRDAEAYKGMFLGVKNRLAIMLRVERIMINFRGNHLDAVKKCLDEVFELKKKLSANSSPLVTMDIGGKYGSGTVKQNSGNEVIREYSMKALESLYSNKWSMSEWEESFVKAAGNITDRGYIAALQRVLASRADCLVLMGSGDFQAMATNDFMQYHNSAECIHLVCNKNNHVQEVIDKFRPRE